MSSLEGNKIAAAILVGGMITLSVGILTDFIYQPHHGAQAAHEGGEGGGAAPAAKPAPPATRGRGRRAGSSSTTWTASCTCSHPRPGSASGSTSCGTRPRAWSQSC